jgi:hypothetical protein
LLWQCDGWQLQDLLGSMLELWNLMDTPAEEQRQFQGVACNIAASEDEITEPGALSMAFISNVRIRTSSSISAQCSPARLGTFLLHACSTYKLPDSRRADRSPPPWMSI